MKVLIGEENRASRTLLENAMEIIDYDAQKAEDEDELIELLREDGFDILFLSWTLPKREGLEFIKKIKEDIGKNPYTILMAPEKKDRDVDLVKAVEAGGDDFLIKPLNRDLIRSRVRKAKTSIELEEKELTTEPLDNLREEHELLRRLANILEVVHYRIKEEVPEKVIDWIGSASLTLDQEVHHKKEKHYLISFIENAMEEQGEDSDSRLFSRASLKQVEEEHDQLEKMISDIQQSVEDYKEEKIGAGEIREMVREYKELLRSHLDREEKFLFPLSAKYMDDETSKELMHRFDKVEEKVGKEKIKKFEKQISKGEETLYLK